MPPMGGIFKGGVLAKLFASQKLCHLSFGTILFLEKIFFFCSTGLTTPTDTV
jgi:hypothetical protein